MATLLVHLQQEALAAIQGQLAQQASVLAFSRLHLPSGFILVVALPLLLLGRKPERRTAQGPAAPE